MAVPPPSSPPSRRKDASGIEHRRRQATAERMTDRPRSRSGIRYRPATAPCVPEDVGGALFPGRQQQREGRCVMDPMQPAPASLEELLAQSSWLRELAASLVRDGATAEDVVQETWLRAL